MGQHFLADPHLASRIVEIGEVQTGETVVEIGPGKGALTFPLLQKGAKVIAIEKDRRLGERLRHQIKDKNFKLIVDNALFALPRLLLPAHYKVIANLPYHITSPVLKLLLAGDPEGNPPPPDLAVLMVQKEVAVRLTAAPGRRERGPLTLMAEYFAQQIEIVEEVPRVKFFPPPQVDSAIVKISGISRTRYPAKTQTIFFRLVRAGFAGKRQKLVNSLSRGLRLDKAEVTAFLEKIGLPLAVRAEDLSLEEWLKLTRCFQ